MIDVFSSFLFSIILHKSRTPLSRKPVVILHSVSKLSRHFFFFSCKIVDNCLKKGFFFFHEQSVMLCFLTFRVLMFDWCCLLFFIFLSYCTKVIPLFYVNQQWFFILFQSLQDLDLFTIYALGIIFFFAPSFSCN